MKKPIPQFISIFLFVISNAFTCVAQQPTNGKAVPSLSSDGVMTRRIITPSEVGWKRYAPEAFGLSFELPGEPFERPYPVPPELRSQILKSKVFDYGEEGLSVNVAHIVFKKSVDLKWFAELMKRSLNSRYHSEGSQRPRISLVPEGDRFLLRANFLSLGNEVEMRALIVGSGADAWLISVQTLPDQRGRAVICSRILESVTISP
jgi:hypothetical protein